MECITTFMISMKITTGMINDVADLVVCVLSTDYIGLHCDGVFHQPSLMNGLSSEDCHH